MCSQHRGTPSRSLISNVLIRSMINKQISNYMNHKAVTPYRLPAKNKNKNRIDFIRKRQSLKLGGL
jgi:hypothetical protein